MSRLSASEVINRGDYLQPDFEPSTLTIPHLLSVLTYHGIKYPSPHTKGKLIEVFNAEIRPRSAQLLKERQVREKKKPSHEGIFDGHTGRAIQAPKVGHRCLIRHTPLLMRLPHPRITSLCPFAGLRGAHLANLQSQNQPQRFVLS